MRVLVFGATGDQGAAQVRRLRVHGHEPVAARRRAGRAKGRSNPDLVNVATVHADYAQPETLAQAIETARPDAVFLTLPSTSFQAAAPLIHAAEAIAGAVAKQPEVQTLVFNASMIVKDRPLGFAAHDARYEMRRRIMANAPAISIEPVIYLDNLLRGWAAPSIFQEDVVCYPHTETLDVSWIAQEDAADLMIAAMTRPALAGRSFTVGGREAVRGPELARRLGAAIERPLRFESEPVDAFALRMASLFEGVASLERERLAGELKRIYAWYNTSPERPFCVDMAPVLETLPVALTSIEAWAEKWLLPQKPDDR